jgi:hypothetical protein
MDYNFYTKDVGLIPDRLLLPLIERAHELYKSDSEVARFNVRVRGSTYKQDEQSDCLVKEIQELISGWSIPELGGNALVPYYTINWVEKGATLHEHSDIANGYSFDDLWTHKIHVPLVTNRGTTFHFRRNFNEPFVVEHLSLGRAYVYNNSCMHKVENLGNARAHLIMYARDAKMYEYYKSTRIWGLLDRTIDPVNV